ncbi:hypothetical protein GGE07_006562 [Sinorhizobium terangae]|nr:hypothetical protein [Sinorhizobium terangae]
MDEPLAVFVGIDVSKDRLDVHLRPSSEAFLVSRDGKGLDELVARLAALPVALVVLEATGGFEVTVAAALAGAGLPLCVVNPRQIRDFARATAGWPRPMRSTPRRSRCLPNASGPRSGRCRGRRSLTSPSSWPGAARSSR